MIAALQLERTGDLVQTIPAIEELAVAEREPIALVVQEALVPLAEHLVPAGVEVRPAPPASLRDLVAATRARAGERVARVARECAERLGLGSARALVNFTWDPAGAAIARAAGVGELVGPVADADGALRVAGMWGVYPIAAARSDTGGAVHMTDVRRGMVRELSGAARAVAGATCRFGPEPLAQQDGTPLALVVTGAGAPERRWPIVAWAEVVRSAAEAGFRVVVSGGRDETDRVEAIARNSGVDPERFDPRRGLVELFETARGARLVIGADTGPTHLAVRAGAAGVMPMLGRSRAGETGPWRPGSLAVSTPGPATGAASGAGVAALVDRVVAAMRALARGEVEGDPPPGCRLALPAPEDDPLGGVVYTAEGTRRLPADRRVQLALAGGDAPWPVLAAAGTRAVPGYESWTRAAELAARAAAAIDAGEGDAARDALTDLGAVIDDLETIAVPRSHRFALTWAVAALAAVPPAPPAALAREWAARAAKTAAAWTVRE